MEGMVTIGVEFNEYSVKIDREVVNLKIWGTAGQENFRSVTKIYYRNTQAVILCYPIDNLKSFRSCKDWVNEIQSQCSPDVMVFLAGMKCDLENERQVTIETALKFRQEADILYSCETSARDGTNIKRLFKEMAMLLYARRKEEPGEMRTQSILPGQSDRSLSILSHNLHYRTDSMNSFTSAGNFGVE